jgi:hypothetical protein
MSISCGACHGQNGIDIVSNSKQVMICDITNDGIPDSVILQLNNPNWNAAVSWNFAVVSNGQNVLNHFSDDNWLDSNFNNTGFVVNCTSYVSCKKRYYEILLMGGSVKKLSQTVRLPSIINRKNIAPMYAAAERFYADSLHFSKEIAIKNANRLISTVKPDMLVLVIPVSPVQSSPPLIFDQVKRLFIPIWIE